MNENELSAQAGKVQGFALVRDRDGKPKIDNIHDIPPAIWALLTADERQEIEQRGGYPSHDLRP